MRHVADAGLGTSLFGHVLMGRDAAAIRHGAYGVCDGPAIGKFMEGVGRNDRSFNPLAHIFTSEIRF